MAKKGICNRYTKDNHWGDYCNSCRIFQTLQGQNRNHESDKQGTGVSQIENGRMVVKGKETSDGRNQDKDRHGQKEIGYW